MDVAEERFVEEFGNSESEMTNICKEVKETVGGTASLRNVETLLGNSSYVQVYEVFEEAENLTATIPDHQTADSVYEFERIDVENSDDHNDYESESKITNNEINKETPGHNEIIEKPMMKDSNDNDVEHKKYEFVDTASLSLTVRHYLNFNQIQWGRFASLVLGISQSRLSTLLGKARPWHLLTKRVQALYERMQLWMDTRATYGNNPYAREKEKSKQKGKQGSGGGLKKRPRSLLDLEENAKLKNVVDKAKGSPAKVMANNDNAMVTLTEEVVEKVINLDAIHVKKEVEDTYFPNAAEDVSSCEVCDLAFSTSQAFGEHVLSVHLTVEGLCDICGGSSDDFVEHFKSHLRRYDAAASPLPVNVKEECIEQNQEEIATHERPFEGQFSLNPFYED